MPCYHPVTAYRSRVGRNPDTGLWPIVFNVKEGYEDKPVILPCGKCIDCRLERSRQWAIRCLHEAQMWKENCFITLTYNDQNIPSCKPELIDGIETVPWKRDYVLFMKRLRKEYGNNIRFFHCGEYGEEFGRPHHHACIFNLDFKDKTLWRVRNGVKLYRSAELQRLWPHGYSTIGEVTFESAAYVARYCTKKITGKDAEEHYQGKSPEYITMSRRPGIGLPWFEKYKDDVLAVDKVIIRNNLQVRPPKYYDNKYHAENPKQMERIKYRRLKNVKETDYKQLEVKEKIKNKKFNKLKRGFENGSTEMLLNP